MSLLKRIWSALVGGTTKWQSVSGVDTKRLNEFFSDLTNQFEQMIIDYDEMPEEIVFTDDKGKKLCALDGRRIYENFRKYIPAGIRGQLN